MTARILPGDDPGAIAEAVALLQAGRPVAFPTETVYGLGADALDPLAVARVFEAKDRPSFDPVIVHLRSPDEIGRYAVQEDVLDERVGALAARFWPGPLTLVLRKREVIPGIVTAGLDTVGLRVPDHPVALRLLVESGLPIAAPSANRFGGLSPTRAEHVARQLGDRIELILDGGPSRVGVESTVLLLAAGSARLLRPGGVPQEEIEGVIGPLRAPPTAMSADRDPDAERPALSPGSGKAHYAPATPLSIVAADEAIAVGAHERVGLLASSAAGRGQAELLAERPLAAAEVPAPDGDPLRFAAGLFEALHRLDTADLDRIVAQPVEEMGIGRAVMDRLRRAARAAEADGSVERDEGEAQVKR